MAHTRIMGHTTSSRLRSAGTPTRHRPVQTRWDKNKNKIGSACRSVPLCWTQCGPCTQPPSPPFHQNLPRGGTAEAMPTFTLLGRAFRLGNKRVATQRKNPMERTKQKNPPHDAKVPSSSPRGEKPPLRTDCTLLAWLMMASWASTTLASRATWGTLGAAAARASTADRHRAARISEKTWEEGGRAGILTSTLLRDGNHGMMALSLESEA